MFLFKRDGFAHTQYNSSRSISFSSEFLVCIQRDFVLSFSYSLIHDYFHESALCVIGLFFFSSLQCLNDYTGWSRYEFIFMGFQYSLSRSRSRFLFLLLNFFYLFPPLSVSIYVSVPNEVLLHINTLKDINYCNCQAFKWNLQPHINKIGSFIVTAIVSFNFHSYLLMDGLEWCIFHLLQIEASAYDQEQK